MTRESYIASTAKRPVALLYMRVASGHQADRDRAIVAQQHQCAQRAAELGAVVVSECVDFGSGLNIERLGLADLLTQLQALRETPERSRRYVIAANHACIGCSVQAYSHVSYAIERAGGWLNIASVALADYEALMRQAIEPNTDWLPPPELS